MARAIVTVRTLARRDIETHHHWLLQEAGEAIAERFLIATNDAFQCLGETRGLGPKVASDNPKVVHLRKWKVVGFPNVVIFYAPTSKGVSIVRVLHAAQDWWRLIDR